MGLEFWHVFVQHRPFKQRAALRAPTQEAQVVQTCHSCATTLPAEVDAWRTCYVDVCAGRCAWLGMQYAVA
eukprot:4683935-Alexandrium_andersonii.AAC.1